MIIITGSLGFDYIMDFPGKFSDRIMPDKIHKLSLSFLVDTLKKQYGGTAGNIGYTLGLLDMKPKILATAGNDFTPYKKFLNSHKVNTDAVKEYKDISTGSYFVITDLQDNQIGSFYTGAMRHAKSLPLKSVLNPRHSGKRSASRIRSWTSQDDSPPFIVIAPNDPSAMKRYVDECVTLKIPYLYDPAFQIDTFSAAELNKGVSNAKILIGNDYEIELLQKKLGITHEKLCSLVPILITTLGEKGALIESRLDKKKYTIKPAKAEKVVDPTGAGDAFRAGFLAGYQEGFSMQTSGQMGAVAAVYTVETYGTTTHTFSLSEFKKRYKENYGVFPT